MSLETDFVPAAEKDSRWLMLVLHGLGDSMEGYRWLPEAMGLPWLNYLLVNAPDPYFMGYSWFDFPGDPMPGVRRSYQLLASLLDAQRQAGFPSPQTYLFGFSQGCLMTWVTGVKYPHRLAGCVGISGFLPDPEALLREKSPLAHEQRFLITHGTLDPLLPFAAAKAQARQMQAAGIQVEWHEFAKAHTIAGEAEMAVIRRFVERCRAAAG
ncbi:serine esterase [Fontisphaera persica]|uniref:alpha/beta hydrolase n=1 Tax=Fontisphaera persica TaxID=2974023 RepID=UPI0024BFB02D|nr:serine esterase [Fontisphaera persica]WCJ59454.1 serine esterase [Fontisphaera persica]